MCAALFICMNQISEGEGYLERTFLSPASPSLRGTEVIISSIEDAGLTTWVDQMGNIHGRFEPASSTKEALLIGSHMPTGENGATRAPIVVDLQREPGLSSKSIVLQIDNKSPQVSSSALRHYLQDRLSKGSSSGSGRGRMDEMSLKLRTTTVAVMENLALYIFLVMGPGEIPM